jgi:hypothetical protein
MVDTVVLERGHPAFIAGRWYQPIPGAVSAGSAITANSIRMVPFFLFDPVTISDLGCNVTTSASGGNLTLAIYTNDPAANIPTGPALAATGNISTTSVGVTSASIAGGDVALPAGWHWMAVMLDATAAATTVLQVLTGATAWMGYLMGSETLSNVSATSTLAVLRLTLANPSSYGTWPDMTALVCSEATSTGYGLVFFKTAAA